MQKYIYFTYTPNLFILSFVFIIFHFNIPLFMLSIINILYVYIHARIFITFKLLVFF